MNLKEQRAAALKAAQDIVAKAKAENRDLTADEVGLVDQKTAEIRDLDARIEQAAKSASVIDSIGRLGDQEGTPAAGEAAKSLGEHFVKTAGEQLRAAKAAGSRFSVSATEYKAAGDTHTVGSVFGPVLTTVDRTIVPAVRRNLQVADLLAQGTLAGNAITYFVEGAREGAFTTVAEGAKKPQLHYADPTTVTDSLKKIAGYIKESDEMVEDLDFLVSAINQRLLYDLALFEEDQILGGNGTGTNLLGLLNRSGIQSIGATTDAKTGNPDTLFKAMTAIQTGAGLASDGIVINPADYQTFRLAKDANNQYYGGGFFAGQYGNGGIQENPPLWGLRTVVTPAIAAGTVLVGAFQQAATLYRKGGVRVESTNSNEDDFVNNKVTIRAEERVALAVRRPAGLVKVTLGTA